MKFWFWAFSAFLIWTTVSASGKPTDSKYAFLDQLSENVPRLTPERARFSPSNIAPINVDMEPFYESFRQTGQVSFFLGLGVQAYSPNSGYALYRQLQALARRFGISSSGWRHSENFERITFRDRAGLPFLIDIGHERNQYASAFAAYDVVMYLGHSRYGRGPAFDGFSNYFRMGNVFSNIEVDTRNPYFDVEPIFATREYPLQLARLGARNYYYQYRGQKVHSSYLPADSFTKVIEGGAKDLMAAPFMPRKQIVWLYSCENEHYFKVPIRTRFPDAHEKLVFGTTRPSYGNIAAAAVMIMSVAAQRPSSLNIVDELNQVENLFTAY